MAYTTISELTTQSDGNIINGEGFVKKGHSFFYLEDIQMVLDQAKDFPETKLSQLQIVNIVFKKHDMEKNHNIPNVTGLALAKSEPQLDENGKIINTDWHKKVALAWPPYYIRGSVTTLENEDSKSPYFGYLFEGSDGYIPGNEITK